MKKLLIIAIFTLSLCGMLKASANNGYQFQEQDFIPHVAKIPHGKIEYYRFGHGTPMILILGYLANVKTWNKPFLQALAAEHDVIIFNNRNVGGSVNSSSSYKAQDLAKDTHDLLKSLHLSHVNVFGISMGGMIAQQFAVSYPEAVDHLILMNTLIAGIQPVMPDDTIQADLYSIPHGKFQQYLMALKILFPPKDRPKMFVTFLRDRFNPDTEETSISKSVIKKQQNLILSWIKDKAALKKIQQLDMPVLILSGGSDALIPYSNTDVLKRNIPHAKLVRWRDGGHVMIFQYPDDIANVINQWFLLH